MALSTSSRARSLLPTALSLLSASFSLWLACSRILAQSPSMPVGSCGPWSLGSWRCPAWPWPPFSSSSLCMPGSLSFLLFLPHPVSSLQLSFPKVSKAKSVLGKGLWWLLGICNNGQRPATPGWCDISFLLHWRVRVHQSQAKWPRRPSCTFPPWPGYILIPPWLAQKTKQISATNTKLLSELSVLYINQQHGCFWILKMLGFSLDSPPGCVRCFCAPGDRSSAFWKQEEKPQGSGCSGAPGLGPHWVSLSVGRSEA